MDNSQNNNQENNGFNQPYGNYNQNNNPYNNQNYNMNNYNQGMNQNNGMTNNQDYSSMMNQNNNPYNNQNYNMSNYSQGMMNNNSMNQNNDMTNYQGMNQNNQDYNSMNNNQNMMNQNNNPYNNQNYNMNNYNQGMNQNNQNYNNMNGYYQSSTSNNNYDQTNSKTNKSNKKILKIVLIVVGVILLLILLKSCSSIIKKGKDCDRLIMVYMVGSNLEGDVGGGTLDLEGVSYSTLESKNTKLIVIAGGTEKWHNNYIDASKTSIYELTSNGYEVVKKQNVSNMGDAGVYKDFLNYAHDNYNAKKYDLIMWNHGLGVIGGESDDLANDFLQASEMKKALESSPFKKDKLELVIFRTCLNDTIEIADTFKDYAEYMAASQEVSWMYRDNNVFKVFNDVDINDDGAAFGKKFVDGYMDYISIMNKKFNKKTHNTYAVLDLSKLDGLEKALGDFFNDINLQSNYSKIAKSRSATFQYGMSQDPTYDSVDIYGIVSGLESLSPDKASKVYNQLKEVVIYNKASDSRSNGLSVYFPYNGDEKSKEAIINKYYDFNGLSSYKNFISSFVKIQTSNSTPFGLSKKATSFIHNSSKKESDFQLKLTDEQFESFDSGSFTIYEKVEGKKYYPVYTSRNIHTDNKTLKGKVKDRQLEIINESDDENALLNYKFYLNDPDSESFDIKYDTIKQQQLPLIEEEETDEYILYYSIVLLSNDSILHSVSTENSSEDLQIDHGKIYLKLDKNTNEISIESLLIQNESIGVLDNKNISQYNIMVDINDYKYISFPHTQYIIEDKDNINPELNPATLQAEISKLKFKVASYSNKKEYYAVFKVNDIYGNSVNSDLIKIN